MDYSITCLSVIYVRNVLFLFLVVNMGVRWYDVGYPKLWTITQDVLSFIGPFYYYFYLILLQASLVSVVFISWERFYAVYWPLKHQTLSTRAYAIVITILDIHCPYYCHLRPSSNLISSQASSYFSVIIFFMFLFILCGCNICVWRKYQMRNISFER